MTLTEKILARAAGVEKIKAGDIVWVDVDQAMMDDILGPRIEIAEKMKALKLKIWNPEKVTIISDHYTPPANAHQASIVKFTRDWAKEYGVKNYYEFAGPCHQVMVEKMRVLPGEVILGTDSHTCTYGALSAFSTGIGSTEMLGVLATGKIWLKVPETIKIEFKGKIPKGVMAKDLILSAIGKIGHAGATYRAMEFSGEAIESLIMDERLCITNMAVEAGAKNGIIKYDEITKKYLESLNIDIKNKDVEFLSEDGDGKYLEKIVIDVEKLEPLCSCPHEVDNVIKAKELKNIKIDQAYIGSCTGGRYNDLKIAAAFIKGKKIAEGTRLLISPASKEIWDRCAKDGILQILSDAGATVLASSCGACLGIHSGALGEGETCISSTNRNFIGRMGSKKSSVYLASPLTVIASAIKGEIVDPRFLSNEEGV
ncbi:MAG: 3-isopropylmalate dehydratase large subunit, partial [Cetobacterium sp.]|uniref:3-isopropylmalate dehydratase large subunit n=1 Tax=Cetobacterium sp. TaxID=2071632 RepID=UPI003F334ABD